MQNARHIKTFNTSMLACACQEEKHIFNGNYSSTHNIACRTQQSNMKRVNTKRRDKLVLNEEEKRRNKNSSGARNHSKHRNMHLDLHLMLLDITGTQIVKHLYKKKEYCWYVNSLFAYSYNVYMLVNLLSCTHIHTHKNVYNLKQNLIIYMHVLINRIRK